MKINIKATGIELTPAISDYVYKKLYLIEEKYFKNGEFDIMAQVEIGKITEHHKSGDIFRAEVHLIGEGLNHYAVEEMDDLHAAIDKVKDEIAAEIRRSKGKNFALTRKGGQIAKSVMKGFFWSMGKVKGIRFRKPKS